MKTDDCQIAFGARHIQEKPCWCEVIESLLAGLYPTDHPFAHMLDTMERTK